MSTGGFYHSAVTLYHCPLLCTHLCIFVGHDIQVDVLVDVHLEGVDHMKEEEGLGRVHDRQHRPARLFHHVDVNL